MRRPWAKEESAMSKDIESRLEALETALSDTGLSPSVSLLEQKPGGVWALSCGLWDGKGKNRAEVSTHQTEGEALAAYAVFLSEHRSGTVNPVLIIDDL